jgi:Arc/MetJ-type ribon-helix-helix transcriptional regulator
MADLVQVNISMSEEDAKIIDQMMVEDAYDNRSAFVRRLVRLEWQRRQLAASINKSPVSITYPGVE